MLAGYLMGNPNAYLYGGMVRHLVAPTIHTDYGDIDVSAASDSVIEESTSRFGYTFRENATSENDPRYFLGKSGRAGKPIQLLLMRTQADALKFIHNAQYGMDRTAYSNHQCWGDPQVGESATLNAIKTKQARLIPGGRDQSLFHPERNLNEQKHQSKLSGHLDIHR